MAQTPATGIPTIGDVILAWRKFHGLRPTELVKKAGIKKGYLSALEHNRKATPQQEYLEKLAAALKVPLLDIYGRKMPPDKSIAGSAPKLAQPAAGQPTNQASAPSTLLYAPLSISDQEVMMYRLAVLERKLEAATKNLQEAYEELRELHALAAQLQRPEEDHAYPAPDSV